MSHAYTRTDNEVSVHFKVDVMRTTDSIAILPKFMITFLADLDLTVCAASFVLCLSNVPNHCHHFNNREYTIHLGENGRMEHSFLTEANDYQIDYRFSIERSTNSDLYFNISARLTRISYQTDGLSFEELYFIQL